MKNLLFYTAIYCIFSISLAAQNNSLRGKVLFLNSDKTPAVGVEISGSIRIDSITTLTANPVYTDTDGFYTLVFPKAAPGHVVTLTIGDKDSNGQALEIVNEEELRICRIPEDPASAFDIIVCKKGERNVAAKRYYGILKTSAERELDRMKKQWSALVAQSEKDYDSIARLGDKITQLEKQTDSLQLYKDALRIASINKDNATKRVLRYLKLLDEGTSIQEARKELSVNKAIDELEVGILKFNAAVTELQTRAEASKSIFDYKDAIKCYDTLINYAEKMGIDRLKMTYYYNKIAIIIFDDGNYAVALEYLGKAMRIREAVLDPKHPDLAAAYNNIGLIYSYSGRYSTALEYHLKAMAIGEAVLDPKHPSLAASYNNIGGNYQFLGRYSTALEYLGKAMSIREAVLGPKHPDLAVTYNNIGLIYSYLGRYSTALEYLGKAMSIREAVLDPKHPSLAVTYNNIGLTYSYLGRYGKALEYHLKTITIWETILDPKHPDLAVTYNNIGGTYSDLGQYKKALEYQRKAINIEEENLGLKRPSLGIGYNNIAMTYLKIKDFQKAIVFQKKCLAIFKESLPENHPNQKKALNDLAAIHYAGKNYPKAITTWQKAAKTFPEIKKEDFYANIGLAYAKNKQFKEAHKAFNEYEKLFPEKGETYRNWAMYYALQNEKEKALSNLKKAVRLGYKNAEWLQTDDSMDGFRDEAVFIEILQKLESSKKEMKDKR